MIYNTIKHDIRNKAGLSMLDYCILEMIYNLSNSGQERYKTWCNASKIKFIHLATKRTIINRFNYLESKGWLEFKDEKRFLKRTTSKYYNTVYIYIKGVKQLHGGETITPVKQLHGGGETIAPLGVKQLHPRGETIAPNKDSYKDNNNNIDKESKEKNTRLKEIQSENENLKAQILELKILNEKQRKKVALKKESASTPLGLSSFEQMEYRRKNKTWTQLDTNFNGGFKMPKEWPENLQNEVLGQWIYLDEKKGQNWGTNRTLSAQINLINDWLKKYNPAEIIESLKDCQTRGNVTPNPKWTINRKLKEKQDDEKQRANNGKSLYENYADYLRGDGDTDEDDTIDISWASA